MKRNAFATLALLAAFTAATAFADDTMLKDHLMMQNGKMMVMEKGKTMAMEKDMTMADGTKVMMNGEVMMKDGKKMMMKDGDAIGMDGKMMHHAMKK